MSETILGKVRTRMLWIMALSNGAIDRNQAFRQACREVRHIERMRPRDKARPRASEVEASETTSAREVLFSKLIALGERMRGSQAGDHSAPSHWPPGQSGASAPALPRPGEPNAPSATPTRMAPEKER